MSDRLRPRALMQTDAAPPGRSMLLPLLWLYAGVAAFTLLVLQLAAG